MKIKTSNNLREWNVKTENHTIDEVIEYVEGVTRDEVRRLTIVYEDNLIAVNGLPISVPGVRDQKESTHDDELVWAYEYFKDRELVEIQYHCHPLDDRKPNITVPAEEFNELIEDVIKLWRVELLKLLEKEANNTLESI